MQQKWLIRRKSMRHDSTSKHEEMEGWKDGWRDKVLEDESLAYYPASEQTAACTYSAPANSTLRYTLGTYLPWGYLP